MIIDDFLSNNSPSHNIDSTFKSWYLKNYAGQTIDRSIEDWNALLDSFLNETSEGFKPVSLPSESSSKKSKNVAVGE